MKILLAAGVIRHGVRYPAPMLPTEQSIDAHLDLISCANRNKVCGNDYPNATALRYRMRMEKAYPTQDEFTAALIARGFTFAEARVLIHDAERDVRSESEPSRFEAFNPENGWGDYAGLYRLRRTR